MVNITIQAISVAFGQEDDPMKSKGEKSMEKLMEDIRIAEVYELSRRREESGEHEEPN